MLRYTSDQCSGVVVLSAGKQTRCKILDTHSARHTSRSLVYDLLHELPAIEEVLSLFV